MTCFSSSVSSLPIGLPGVHDLWILDVVQQSLVIKEVKHVLDGQGQRWPTVGCAEDPLKQVVHKLLQRALKQQKQMQ